MTSSLCSWQPSAWIVVLAFSICSASGALAKPVSFDIPAQPAPAALDLFIKQSGVQVTFSRDDLAKITANAVSGDFEPVDALTLLIKGIGLTFSQRDGGWFVVVREKKDGKGATGSVKGSLRWTDGSPAYGVNVYVKETGEQINTDKRGEFVFQSLAPGTYELVARSEGYQPMEIDNVVVEGSHELTLKGETMRKAEDTTKLEPFVVQAEGVTTMNPYLVTDTKPEPFSDRNVDLPRSINDVQPYYIFDSQTINESGTTDVEEFLKERLTMDTTNQTNAQKTIYSSGIGSGGAASSIDLQGLGIDHTLILVNGLPLAGVSAFNNGTNAAIVGQPDLNGIPFAAIDHIEVLPSSAGAIYGPGAEGGVINVILKKAYNGGDITATYASTWDGYGPTRTIEGTLGRSFENGRTQLLVVAQYSDSQPMFVRDRINLLNRGYSDILENNPDIVTNGNSSSDGVYGYFPPVGATTNVGSVEGIGGTDYAGPFENLTLKGTNASLIGSPIATFPPGYNGNLASLIGGKWNMASGFDNEAPNGLLLPLASYPRRKSFLATITREMSKRLTMHFDVSYSGNRSYSDYNPLNTAGGILVPSSAPINPFNQDVFVSFPANLTAPATATTNTTSLTIGGTLKLPYGWIAHVDYQWSRSAFESSLVGFLAGGTFSTSPTFAGDGTTDYNGNPDNFPTPLFSGAINPFTDTLAHPINWSPFTETQYATSTTTANDLVIAASGLICHFPWGDPRLSIRLEHNKTGEPQGATFSNAPQYPSLVYPGLSETWYTQVSYGQTQSTNNANAELDVPIFKSSLFLLHSLDAQINFGSEMTDVGIGTPGYEIIPSYPYNPILQYLGGAPGVNILGPNTLSSYQLEPVASGAKPFRSKISYSNSSVTGPALSYQPTDDLIIRGSIATGYVPPTYSELLPNETGADSNPQGGPIMDPKNPAVPPYYVNEIDGGNPHLKPETSRTWNLGVIWTPKWSLLKGFRFDAEFSEIKQHNLIENVSDQYLVDFENQFPGLVVRNTTTGLVETVYNEPVNIDNAKNENWTFSLEYRRSTAWGKFDLTAGETIEEHDEQQLGQGLPLLEFVGYPNSGGIAKTKANVTLRWSLRNWVAAWTTIYYDGYKQQGAPGDPEIYQGQAVSTGNLDTYYLQSQGGLTIPSQIYHNLFLSYSFRDGPFDRSSRRSGLANDALAGVKISLGVNNILNRFPPFDAYYEPLYASPYGGIEGRNYSLSVQKSF